MWRLDLTSWSAGWHCLAAVIVDIITGALSKLPGYHCDHCLSFLLWEWSPKEVCHTNVGRGKIARLKKIFHGTSARVKKGTEGKNCGSAMLWEISNRKINEYNGCNQYNFLRNYAFSCKISGFLRRFTFTCEPSSRMPQREAKSLQKISNSRKFRIPRYRSNSQKKKPSMVNPPTPNNLNFGHLTNGVFDVAVAHYVYCWD